MKHHASKILAALLFSSLVISFLALKAQAQTSQEILDQYISDLQKNPNDKALREKIIRMASELEPRPVIPDEAKRPFYKAATFFKEAQDPSGYDLAIRAYKDAIRIAPWWPEAYFNLGIAQEKAELFGEAVETLKLYLLTQPEDAEDAEKKLYELEAKGELAAKAAKESSPEAVAARNEQYFVDEVHDGIVDLNIGRLEDAIQHWEKAIEISPENQQVDVPLYNIGEAYMNLNDLDKAYKYMQRAFALQPERPNAAQYTNMGVILERRGDKANACIYYEKGCERGSEVSCKNYRNACKKKFGIRSKAKW